MTNYKITNLDIIIYLFSKVSFKKNSSIKFEYNLNVEEEVQIDSFYYTELTIPQQTPVKDSHLEQICNIY